MELIANIVDAAMRQGKRLVPGQLKRRIKVALGVPDMEASLQGMKRRGFGPRTVIDVGAYTGEWTRMCRALFPDARILMIEPQPGMRPQLEYMAREDAQVSFAPALAGDRSRPAVPFYQAESGSSIFRDADGVPQIPTELPMTTLDAITSGTGFASPDFLKLDVQGAELAVLEGASAALASAEAILMEVNLLEIYSSVPLLDRAVAFMAERDFRVYDICTFFRRPLDNALWQTDMIFVKSSSPLLASKNWGRTV